MRRSCVRSAALLVCLFDTVAAQRPQQQPTAKWLARLQATDLAGLAAQLARPGETWPALGRVPIPLASRIHQKIKDAEGSQPPRPEEIGPRVRLYADLARRFRSSGGYANQVLADTLTILSVLHVARLLDGDPQRAGECLALWTSLDPPALTERIFQDAYRAKVGAGEPLEAASPAQMLETMKRLGEGDIMGWPPEDVIFSQGTGALLAVTSPKAFLYRFSSTALLGRSALRRWIEFVQKGGRTEDLAAGRIEDFEKLFPTDYGRRLPETFGPFPLDADAGVVAGFIRMARNPQGPPFLSWALDGPRRAAQSRFQVTERVIGKVSGFRTGFGINGSPDMRRYHLLEASKPDGSGQSLVTERGRSRLYDGIHGISYNRQATRLAFIGHRAGQAFVVVDGVESAGYDRGTVYDLQFSPDGRHVAFLAQRGGDHFLVVDGRESAPQPDLCGLAYSPAGELAWMARRQGLWRMVYRGEESAGYPAVNGPIGITFSPDGRSWAYQMSDDSANGDLTVVEGAVAVAYRSGRLRRRPVFSADGRLVLFEMDAGPDQVEVRIAQLGTSSTARPRTTTGTAVHVSADLQRVAAVDRIPGAPGGKRTHRVTIDGRRWEMQSQTEPIFQFSPLGTRFVLKGDTLLIDGQSVGSPGETGPWSEVLFSPDDRSFAYVRSIPGTPGSGVVRDGKQIQSNENADGGNFSHLTFSPDGRRLAYVVPKGPGYVALAVDGEEAPPIFDYVPYNARLVFDAPNRFHTIACRNGEVLQVDVTWTDR